MRNRWIASVLLAVCVSMAFVTVSPAPAQYRPQNFGNNPAGRPGFSPYLNLTRTDINPVISYYGIIRPQLAATSEFQQLQAQQNNLATQQQQAFDAANTLPVTGHAAGFQTQNKYFLNKSAPNAGAGGAAPAAGGAAGQPKVVRR